MTRSLSCLKGRTRSVTAAVVALTRLLTGIPASAYSVDPGGTSELRQGVGMQAQPSVRVRAMPKALRERGDELDTAATAAGDGFAALLARLGTRERDRIARRTPSGLAELRAEGRSVGRPAVADRPELRDRIGEMRTAGITWQAIADQLDDAGGPTLRGGAGWRPSSVQATLRYRRPGWRSAGEVEGTTAESSVRSAFMDGEL